MWDSIITETRAIGKINYLNVHIFTSQLEEKSNFIIVKMPNIQQTLYNWI